jgi:uncharacterized protein (TIGR02246 family)
MATKMIVALVVAAVLGLSAPAFAQQGDPDLQKFVDEYQQAFNKGDAKAVAAFYTTDALRLWGDGQFLSGRDAIHKSYEGAFAGPLKGGKLTLRPGRTVNVSQDVRIQEGVAEVTGAPAGPMKSRYLNTFIRQGGQWRVASVTVVQEAGGAKPQGGASKPPAER